MDEQIMVSICCITYNQEKYIAQALDSFLMQKTNFNIEIIIGEDCSTDNTSDILETYKGKYPNIIRVISSEKNVGAIKNQVRTIKSAKGKYIAMCDGDDYWTDVYKLQKQIDFLEKNKTYVICCHYTTVINDKNEIIYKNPNPKPIEYAYEDVLLGNREETRVCSMVLKNNFLVRSIGFQDWYYKTYGSDTLFKLFVMASTQEKLFVMPEVMGVYRLHDGGVWSLIDAKVRKTRMISDFNLLINNFSYSKPYKRKLLMFYLNKYFLFDIKTLNISGAAQTISTLI